MNLVDICLVLGRITYKPGYEIYLGRHPEEGRLYLQVSAEVHDSELGKRTVHRGRKWDISEHMTDSEIVQTALKAFLTFEEHEARESFSYRGVKIFGPHLDVDELAALIRSSQLNVDVREEKS